MSNKIVPAIYRAVIDDVIASIKPDFDEYGISEDVLAELQHKWEAKVIASHVAEFETPPPQPQAVPPHNPSHPSVQAHAVHHPHAPPHHAYPPHPMHAQYYPYPHPPPPPPPGPQIKTEPVDPRFVLSGPSIPPPPPPASYQALPGPQIPPQPPRPGGQVMSFPAPPAPTARYQAPPAQPAKNGTTNGRIPQADGPSVAGPSRIPQADGPSSSSESGSPTPPPATYAPRGAAHPSLPQPMQSRADQEDDDEAINSDLDDSDSDAERDDPAAAGAETDIVFCTYDKVARVKNKWKCILKDGMIHINGKDYLFAKCTGEFEW